MTLLNIMASLKSVTMKGESAGTIDVSDALFDVKGSLSLVHQVVCSLQANQREAWAHTKDRSERRGGGKKPWKQKGTGRARHGSSRSPIWRKGGVTFGPRNTRSYKSIIPRKMRQRAVVQLLTSKRDQDLCVVLIDSKNDAPDTKAYAQLFEKSFPKGSRLLVTAANDPHVVASIRNIPRTSVVHADVLNALDLVQSKHIVITDEAVKVLEERFVQPQAE